MNPAGRASNSTDMSEVRSDVRSWLTSSVGIRAPLEEILRVISYPGSIEQNVVGDLVDKIVGTGHGIEKDRWLADWNAVAAMRSPTDQQDLYIPLGERGDEYDDLLPHLETTVYTVRRGEGPALMLNGHVDVVPVTDQDWTSSAFDPTYRDGRLIARGAMDMKAGLVAAALTFRYMAERWTGPGTLQLAVVAEEETGGNGTLAVLQRGHVPDAVVFTEPTDLKVVHRHVGIQAFDIDVEGHPGGMLKRSWGMSAAPTLARIALALEELEIERTRLGKLAGGYHEDDLPGFINFTMTAGDWLATRAAKGHLEGLMSVLPGETQDEAAAHLREAVMASVSADELATQVRVRPGGHRGAELPDQHHLVTAFGPAATGPGSPTKAGTMVCDAKIVHGGGWAPAIVLGPIGGNLHSADEWVDLQSLHDLIGLLAAGIYRYAHSPTETP